MEPTESAAICENCRKQARLMNPAFSVMVRSSPGNLKSVDNSTDLTDRLKNDDVYMVKMTATKPAATDGKYGNQQAFHNADEVRSWTPEQFDNWAIETLAYRIHPKICEPSE